MSGQEENLDCEDTQDYLSIPGGLCQVNLKGHQEYLAIQGGLCQVNLK